MAKQRDGVLDAMRGIGIVLMVVGHSGFAGTAYIYLFHMALFFMLSGYFSTGGGSFGAAAFLWAATALPVAALCGRQHRLHGLQ